MTDKADSRSANHAHDQETQTNFDINTNNSVRAANNHTQRQLSQVSRMHSSFPFRHPPSPGAWNRGGYYYPPSAPYSEHCYSPYEAHYPSPHGHPSHCTYPIPQWHPPTSPVLGPNVPVHSAIRRQGYPMDGYHHPYYNLHNSMAPPGVNAMISHEPTTPHQEIEIARPKPEWPSGHGPHIPSKFSVLPSDYLRAMSSRGAGTECTGPPSTATSLRSTEIEFSANMSAAPSPRQTRKLSRKRALSNSPCSIDALDLNSIIRYSPDALLAYVSGSRASSASSFGHLITPIALSPANPRTPTAMPPCPVRQNPFITPHGPPLQSPTTTTTTTNQKDVPSSTTNTENDHEEDMSCTESVKASSTHETESVPVVKDEAMEECQLDSTTSPSAETKVGSDAEADYVAGEGDHQELVCQWKDCNTVFESQEELVKHANGDHIKKERKDFTCYWKDCSREQKPFKAQYMLVVHMRRHTGEKPHKCSFEGCSKAYSRLENLKTHLRSHTGERPYECEVEGCNKAFSNASDRAKHQNRTHSSVKPYVCKVPGCTKRYTDPSSLRKHTKTVHGDQGVKKLKTDNHKEKPPQDQGRKNAPSGKPSQTANNVCCNSKNPNSVQTTQIKSVIKETRSRETKGSSYSGHVTGNSCDSDTVSSSCELSPGPADSSGSMGMALSVTHSTRNSRRSPRSPLIPNHLPDILEAEPCDNAVTTVQQVISVSQSHGHLLPKLESKGRDVETWVRDVSRRMSDVTSKPNETGNLFESDGDMSRRSSGWSSYNDSRRSSLASPSPAVSMQKNCGIDFHHQINTTSYSKRQGCDFEKSSLQLTEMSDSNLVVRRSSEASMLSAPGNRLSRNSSGYGSQSNLAFLKLPPLNRTFSPPNGRFHANQTHRRLSDTVICEADSSGMYMNSQGRELRRRSEPPGQVVGTSTRQEPLSFQQPKPLQNFKETNEMKERTPIAEPCIDPRDLDLFRTPQHTDHNQLNGVADAQPQTQRLRHYPYTEETVFDQQQRQQEVVSQVIHHRPNSLIQPKPLSQPKPRPHHMPNAPMPTAHQGDLQKSHQLLQQKLYSVQQQQQQGTQNDIFAGYSNQKQNEYNAVYPEVVPQQYPNGTVPSGVSYEDLMVDRMGALSTEADPTEQTFNAGNMVINHMDTLLNSLAEEDKYLDLTNCSRIASALSGTMF